MILKGSFRWDIDSNHSFSGLSSAVPNSIWNVYGKFWQMYLSYDWHSFTSNGAKYIISTTIACFNTGGPEIMAPWLRKANHEMFFLKDGLTHDSSLHCLLKPIAPPYPIAENRDHFWRLNFIQKLGDCLHCCSGWSKICPTSEVFTWPKSQKSDGARTGL
jgi:hypothetical protein